MLPAYTDGYLNVLETQVQQSRELLTGIQQIWGQVVRALGSKGIILEGCEQFDALVRDGFGSLGEIENSAARVEGYLSRMNNVLSVSGMLTSSEHYLETPALVLDRVIALIHAERAYLLLDDAESGLRLAAGRNARGETVTEDMATFSRGMIAECLRKRQPLIVSNAGADTAYGQNASVIDYELRSIALVPLILEDRVIGVLYADNRVKEGVFSSVDVPLLLVFGNLAATALSNAQLYEKQVVANRVKDQFLGMMSHELRTPLNVISGFSELMIKQIEMSGAAPDPVAILRQICQAVEAHWPIAIQIFSVLPGKEPAFEPMFATGPALPAGSQDIVASKMRQTGDNWVAYPMLDRDTVFGLVLLQGPAWEAPWLETFAQSLNQVALALQAYHTLRPDRFKPWAVSIYAGGQRMLGLVTDLLETSALEAGQVIIRLQPVTLQCMADDLAAVAQGLNLERKRQNRGELTFSIDAQPGVPATLMTDAKRLSQVLINLVSNAFKFTKQGSVTLRIRVEDGQGIAFAVTDTGPGIPEGYRELIFERFRQIGEGDHRPFGGSGLGLYISRQLCNLMGYQLVLDTDGQHGSTFTIQGVQGVDHVSAS